MKQHSRSKMAGLILLLTGSVALAQGIPQGQAPPPQPPAADRPGMPPEGPGRAMMPPQPHRQGMLPQPGRPPLERALGGWWNNPEMMERLGITADQKKKMDDILQQHRLKLIDLTAALQKAEVILEPLIAADQPDESKIVAQIDRVAQARAELEKANARMLLGIRQVLTPEQWKRLQAQPPKPGRVPGASPRPGPAPGPVPPGAQQR